MVIKQVKHWMKLRASAALWKPIAHWSQGRGGVFKLTEDGEGFAIDESVAGLGPCASSGARRSANTSRGRNCACGWT